MIVMKVNIFLFLYFFLSEKWTKKCEQFLYLFSLIQMFSNDLKGAEKKSEFDLK